MYSLYSLATLLLFLAASPYFLYQAVRHGKYAGSLPERLGSSGVAQPRPRAVHLAPRRFGRGGAHGEGHRGRAQGPVSHLRLFVSTTTMTGQRIAAQSFPMADGVFFFPIDLGVIVRRVLDIVRPQLFVMMETEIWPNLLRECRARGVKTVVINGRISTRSFPRYRAREAALPARALARRSVLRAGRGNRGAAARTGSAARSADDHGQPQVRRSAGAGTAGATRGARIGCCAT